MDTTTVNRADWERRRRLRLTQVRDQSKAIAKSVRDRVHSAVELQADKSEALRKRSEHKFKSLAVTKLKSDFDYLIKDIGHGYSVASDQADPNVVLIEKRLVNRCKAISRGVEAEKRQKLIQEEKRMDKEMNERRTHFNRTVEKIRSALITSIPNVNNSNGVSNTRKYNECFLLPSQVTLNESNILNWNSNKKNPKPWSAGIISNENINTKLYQSSTIDNKENEPKFKQLENDVKNYASLVSELDKLSAEEQNIKIKLFAHKNMDAPVLHDECVFSSDIKINKLQKLDEVKHNFAKSSKSNEKHNIKTEKKIDVSNSNSSIYSSSESTDIKNTSPGKPTKKTVNFENINIKPSYSTFIRSKKSTPEKPSKNINHLLQRIKNKKQLLAKEISVDRVTDVKKEIPVKRITDVEKQIPVDRITNVKKSNTASSIPKTATNHKRCAAGHDSYKRSQLIYPKLPDSFYGSQINTLKEQIAMEKTKYNTSMNSDLMRYIHVLLKMSPSDVENLSTSSCSSVKLEESLLEHTKEDKQLYHELLNCIAKCCETDLSDISHETSFESPKNINVINRLQELANYFSDKTYELKNICDEPSQTYIIETENENSHGENTSVITSDSSVDGEYLFGHLNTLMRKKGLIKSDKEWPLFEDKKDYDDNRSLTEQLLDV